MDALYVLGNGSKWKDNELRYSLRSLEKYCKDLDNVWIVGNCPDWITGVNYIECADPYDQKERNTLHKTLVACESEISDNFMKLDDDFFFCKEFYMTGFPVYSKGKLSDTIDRLNEFKRYRNVLINTRSMLLEIGMDEVDFEVHNPVVYNRGLFKILMQDTGESYCMKSLYFNALGRKGIESRDMKVNIPLTSSQIQKELEGVMFFSVGDFGLNTEMKQYLEKTYPTPSRFER